MRTRRSHRDLAKCALCPTETNDLRRGLCFVCYQRHRRHGALQLPAVCVGFQNNECRVSDPRLLRPFGQGLRCLNCLYLSGGGYFAQRTVAQSEVALAG